jgi:hypothetical protein
VNQSRTLSRTNGDKEISRTQAVREEGWDCFEKADSEIGS